VGGRGFRARDVFGGLYQYSTTSGSLVHFVLGAHSRCSPLLCRCCAAVGPSMPPLLVLAPLCNALATPGCLIRLADVLVPPPRSLPPVPFASLLPILPPFPSMHTGAAGRCQRSSRLVAPPTSPTSVTAQLLLWQYVPRVRSGACVFSPSQTGGVSHNSAGSPGCSSSSSTWAPVHPLPSRSHAKLWAKTAGGGG
jgi:hypothetical protein